jgi:iron-sulfur cluster repair protein YtfE (RIC family)
MTAYPNTSSITDQISIDICIGGNIQMKQACKLLTSKNMRIVDMRVPYDL